MKNQPPASQITLRHSVNSESQQNLSSSIETRIREFYQVNGWEIDEYLEPMIILLALYGANDPEFEDCDFGREHNLCLGKGIGIVGTVGSSKSTLMKALNYALTGMGSYMTFHTYTTRTLAEAWQKEKGGGLESMKLVRNAHICYDEIGLRDIAPVKHYSREGNIDRMLIDMRAPLFADGGMMLHFTSNMQPKEMEDWLEPKYFSRLQQMCNMIPYLNNKDYRTITRPRRRVPDSAPTLAETQRKNEIARDRIMTKFIAEVLLYLSNGEPLYLSDELMVYDSLIELEAIQHPSKLMNSPYYNQAMESAKQSLIMQRANLDVKDKHKATELADLIKQCEPGMAMTTPMQTRLLIAYKKIVVREFVKEKLNTKENVDKMFPKV